MESILNQKQESTSPQEYISHKLTATGSEFYRMFNKSGETAHVKEKLDYKTAKVMDRKIPFLRDLLKQEMKPVCETTSADSVEAIVPDRIKLELPQEMYTVKQEKDEKEKVHTDPMTTKESISMSSSYSVENSLPCNTDTSTYRLCSLSLSQFDLFKMHINKNDLPQFSNCQNKQMGIHETQNGYKGMVQDRGCGSDQFTSVGVKDIPPLVGSETSHTMHVLKNKPAELLCKSEACEEEFAFLSELQTHTAVECYRCDHCGDRFDMFSNLKRHIRGHLEDKFYTCPVCGVVFPSRSGMLKHKITHAEEKLYKCDVCDVKFASVSKLQTHKIIHTGEKVYKCEDCGVRIKIFNNLKRHLSRHLEEKLYKCAICNVEFSSNHAMLKHKRTHTGVEHCVCDVCGLVFSYHCNMLRHKKVHTGEKPFKCDICGLGFSSSYNMQEHRRTHTGEKPYACFICGTAFTSKANMSRHRRRVHIVPLSKEKKEKPHVCAVCSFSFSVRQHLMDHMRTHTGEKPYLCDVCGVEFSTLSHMRKHKVIHTGEKNFQCEVCGRKFARKSNLQSHIKIKKHRKVNDDCAHLQNQTQESK